MCIQKANPKPRSQLRGFFYCEKILKSLRIGIDEKKQSSNSKEFPVRFRMAHIRKEKVNPVEIPDGIMLKEVELLVMGFRGELY